MSTEPFAKRLSSSISTSHQWNSLHLWNISSRKLNTIGVGTGYNQRIGDSVKLRRIEGIFKFKRGDNFNVTRTIIGACRNSTYPPVPLGALTGGTNPDFGPYLLGQEELLVVHLQMVAVELRLLRSTH